MALPPRASCADGATVRLATRDDAEGMRAVYAPYVETPVTFDVAVPAPDEFAARMSDAMPARPRRATGCCLTGPRAPWFHGT